MPSAYRLLFVLTVAGAWALAAQENPVVREAQAAFDGLEFSSAVGLARRALGADLSTADRTIAYEVLGFSLGALDSADAAVDAFVQMIVLDPDHDPDRERFPPRLLALYSQALGEVLVVRKLRVDSATFVAGQGAVPIRFDVSRPSWVSTRVVGGGATVLVDSQLADPGPVLVAWSPVAAGGDPLPPATYQVIVSAWEGRNQFQAPTELALSHGTVDTLPHVTELPGFAPRPEMERPPRDWRPLGIASIFTAAVTGASLALENSQLGGARREIVSVSLGVLLTGVVLSIRQPDPRPVEANIVHNQMLQQLIQARNQVIAEQNEQLRRQVRITVRPATGAAR